jgi:TolA-binding protein
LGYTYYQQKDYENAISQFNKIIDGKDSVAQNAYYHLGECYFKTDKKQQALNAFKSASEMDFDKKIQEDANLNYAKLSYDIGNSFQSVPDVLSAFLNKYPNSPSKKRNRKPAD